MNEEELTLLSNVLCDKDGFKFVLFILKRLGAFDRGLNCNLSDKEIFMTLGKREQGLRLLDDVIQANFNKYKELLEERNKQR